MVYHSLTYLVLFLYLAGITWLGVRMGKGIQKQSDFFMPRRFGKSMMMMHAFGTGTASDQAVVVASGTFRHGLSGIWYQWLWLFNTPFYWLIAPIFRRFRATTTADVYALRFGSSVAVLFSMVGIIGLAVKIGLLLKGAGALVESGTQGMVSASFAVPVVAVLFVAYGMVGGAGSGDCHRLHPGGFNRSLFSHAIAVDTFGGRRSFRGAGDLERSVDAFHGGTRRSHTILHSYFCGVVISRYCSAAIHHGGLWCWAD
jgi:hypothetical protein